jgi:hypothetical protein
VALQRLRAPQLSHYSDSAVLIGPVNAGPCIEVSGIQNHTAHKPHTAHRIFYALTLYGAPYGLRLGRLGLKYPPVASISASVVIFLAPH